jgi:hypothetical protein
VWNLLLRVYRTEVERLAKCGSKKREGRPGMRIFSGVKLSYTKEGLKERKKERGHRQGSHSLRA